MIYLDHAAATPVDPEILRKMLPYFSDRYGNPSSLYAFGREAKSAIETARATVGEILHVREKEIIFTGGGTEANNLAIFGLAQGADHGKHIIITKIEHDSILEPVQFLEKNGFEVTYIDVGEDGIVKAEDVLKAVNERTVLVRIMYANNEIGTIQPVDEISALLRERFSENQRPVFHVDACQAAGYLDISFETLGVDAMTLNAGKIYGPKGAGALILRSGIKINPQIRGGGQEWNLRPGTENVPAIVGFAEALKMAQARRADDDNIKKIQKLRDRLIDGILKIPESRLNGDRGRRLPGNVNISFPGLEGETILLELDKLDIAASSGSACATRSLLPSHVITALGLPEEWTHGSVRFSLGRSTTEQEIDFVLDRLPAMVKGLRERSPF